MNVLKRLFIGQKEENRSNNINIIRFVAAAMVIYGHMASLADFPLPVLFGEPVSHLAVKIFFVLSGYLILQSFLRDENFFRYMVRRTFRIMPGLIFVVVVSAFLLGPALSENGIRAYLSNPSTYEYLKNILMYPIYYLPGVFSDNFYPTAVNGSLWTLPVEFLMYLILPFFVVIFRKLKILKPGLFVTALGLFVFHVVQVFVFPEARFVVWGTDLFQALSLAPYFFAGAFLSFPEAKNIFNMQWAFSLLFLGSILVFKWTWLYETVVFLLLPYATLTFSLASPAIFGRVFAVHDYSYGLYLWGFPVQQTFVHYVGAEAMSLLLYTVVCFFIALLCAMVSWHFVERPCNRLGRKIILLSKNKKVSQDTQEA